MVRIYLTEGKHQLEALMQRLHDQYQVRGVTAFRGISGFGQSGKMHSSNLLDVSLDLPVIVEFFDEPEKVRQISKELQSIISPGHMVMWDARVNL